MRLGRVACRVTLGPPGKHAEGTLYRVRDLSDVVMLTDLYTPAALRGQGYAAQVIDALLTWADWRRQAVVTYARSHGRGSRPDNTALEAFYTSKGFVPYAYIDERSSRWMLRPAQYPCLVLKQA